MLCKKYNLILISAISRYMLKKYWKHTCSLIPTGETSRISESKMKYVAIKNAKSRRGKYLISIFIAARDTYTLIAVQNHKITKHTHMHVLTIPAANR